MADNKGDIFVEADFDNIFSVDPNRIYDEFGNVQQRLVNHEELVMYANLECNVLPRTKLQIGTGQEEKGSNVVIASGKINFMNPGDKNSLDTNWTDIFTPKNVLNGDNLKNSRQSLGSDQLKNEDYEKNQSYTIEGIQETSSSPLLGITSISYKINTSFLPNVTITLEDVKGRALFESGDESPYAAFFNLPYPIFYLTLKGYYGKATRIPLQLVTFNASFETERGNFVVTLNFYGYKYSMLSEIPLQALTAIPHMVKKRFSKTEIQNPQSTTTVSDEIATTRGLELINNVYSKYVSKGLIRPNFPRYTVIEFMNKLDQLESNMAKIVSNVDFNRLTDIKTYDAYLNEFNKEIKTYNDRTLKSWFNTYKKRENPNIILLKKKEEINQGGTIIEVDKIIYTYEPIDGSSVKKSYEDSIVGLEKIIVNYRKKFYSIPSFQDITFDIKLEDFYTDTDADQIKLNNIDLIESYKRNGKTFITEQDGPYVKFVQSISDILRKHQPINLAELKEEKIPYICILNYERKYDELVKQFKIKAEEYRDDIAKKIRDEFAKDQRLGFDPNIRNVSAVIFASIEAFISLLDETHFKAWNVRNSIDRKRAISKSLVDKLESSNDPVYPWPQVVEFTQNGNQQTFEIKYPGDRVGGQNASVWPEVFFVEEFINGLTQRNNLLNNQNSTNKNQITESGAASLVPLDFPAKNIIYLNKDEVKFFYEIWERLFMLSFYSRISKTNDGSLYKLIADYEANNIIKALEGTSLSLKSKLKNYEINRTNFPSILKSFSNNGTGQSWNLLIRELFNTSYIESNVNNSTEILSSSQVDIPSSFSTETESNLVSFLSSTKTNDPDFFDIYPFTSNDWVRSNLADGISTNNSICNNTTETIFLNEKYKTITNYRSGLVKQLEKTNLPVVNFNYSTPPFYPNTTEDLETFYNTRIFNDYLPTEGYIRTENSKYLLTRSTIQKTTSILNTPIFINSILTGLQKFRQNNKYPFVVPAYLFINSLPLSTLREKSKSYDAGITTSLDYLFAQFKKFSATHKVPYAWILKYGSIWHRYKNFIETGNDILDNDWNHFDYTSNYDPTNLDPTTVYNLDVKYPNGNIVTESVVLQSNVIVSPTLEASVLNLGFYPYVIDQFNLFYQGLELIGSGQPYTDTSINNVLNNNLFVLKSNPVTNSTNVLNPIRRNKGFDLSNTGRTLNITTWSCMALDTKFNSQTEQVYILPSFGTKMNETIWECFKKIEANAYNTMSIEVTGNTAMFDGSVRLFWGAPNFGFFDISGITKPSPTEYMKEVFSASSSQANFGFQKGNYTNISEMFSTFEKKILDLFEQEFLNFSKSRYDVDGNNVNENFQNLLTSLMLIPKVEGTNFDNILTQVIENQNINIIDGVESLIKYQKFVKLGNPSNFDRRQFYSLAGMSSVNKTFPNQIVIDPYTYFPYNFNLPPDVSFSTSVSNSPKAWKELQLNVGFSDIPQLSYGGQSYITDFFRDMNVEFSENNVRNLVPLIKLYATQKLKDNTLDKDKFQQLLSQNLNSVEEFRDGVIDALFSNQKLLSQIQQAPNEIEGENSINFRDVENKTIKVELYEMFKAFNDKYVSGGDFETKTFFEDLLFLDRSSRDVGEEIIVDIFRIKNLLKSRIKNETQKQYVGSERKLLDETDTLSLITTIIEPENFRIMPIAGYTNFFGIDNPNKTSKPVVDDPLDLANSLFGTYQNVDTRKSAPKLVCFYANKASEQLSIQKQNYYYKNDSWNFNEPSNHPLRAQIDNNFGLNNKVVGFTVDVGIQNQNIFTKINVGQTAGKATAESLEALNKLANQGGMQGGYSTSVSLYNQYKTRSYTCEVSMFGNVMIQPMMYFNLRHVPMFEGPYLIFDVQHDVRPGSFETKISGIRQPVATLGNVSKDEAILRIKSIYLQQIESKITINIVDGDPITAGQEISNNPRELGELIISSLTGKKSASFSNDCQSGLFGDSQTFEPVDPQKTELPLSTVGQYISDLTDNTDLRKVLFSVVWLKSINEQENVVAFNNNLIDLSLNIGNINTILSNNSTRISKQFVCVNLGGKQFPFAVFTEPRYSIEVLYNFFKEIVEVSPKYDEEKIADLIFDKWTTPFYSQNVEDGNLNLQQSDLQVFAQERKDIIEKIRQGIIKGANLGLWSSPLVPAPDPQSPNTTNVDITFTMQVVATNSGVAKSLEDRFICILKSDGNYILIQIDVSEEYDPVKFKLIPFDTNGYPFTLVSNPDQTISYIYNPEVENYIIVNQQTPGTYKMRCQYADKEFIVDFQQ